MEFFPHTDLLYGYKTLVILCTNHMDIHDHNSLFLWEKELPNICCVFFFLCVFFVRKNEDEYVLGKIIPLMGSMGD